MRLTKLITIALAATAILLLAIESGRQRIQLILMQRELTTALENEREILELLRDYDGRITHIEIHDPSLFGLPAKPTGKVVREPMGAGP